jgi:hypothetical protein
MNSSDKVGGWWLSFQVLPLLLTDPRKRLTENGIFGKILHFVKKSLYILGTLRHRSDQVAPEGVTRSCMDCRIRKMVWMTSGLRTLSASKMTDPNLRSFGWFWLSQSELILKQNVANALLFSFFFWVSDPLCLSPSLALHFFQLFFLGPPPC